MYRSLAGQNATLIYDNLNSNIVGTNQLVQAIETPAGVDVFIRNGARFTHPAGHVPGLVFNVRGDLTIGDGGLIDVNGCGFPGGQGWGRGSNGTQQTLGGAGGGYGGLGGASLNGAPGGNPYGSDMQPTDLGSGGGTSFVGGLGTSGGGAIRLSVGGILTLSGSITANGTSISSCGNTQTQGGPGSGGSVWITAGSIVGNGTISAAGGSGCAGAGGGRVAVYSCARTLPASHISSLGGTGYFGGTGPYAGNANPVYLETALITQQPISTVSCELADAVFDVAVIGPGPYTYQWRKGAVPLSDGPTATGTLIIGAASPRLTLRGITAADEGSYDCIVSTACGGIPSTVATLLLSRPCSVADVVGTDGGPRVCGDSTVDGADFIAFINSFSVGDATIDPIADIAGGGETGELPDGTIDGTDFIAFINAFAIGC